MEAKKLEILMTAVDLGSFSKASEVVGYTQSGLTHLVNSLEREIGFPLIIRSHNGISLTEQGKKAYYHHKDFHEKMVLAVLKGLNVEETEALTKALTKLQGFFRSYQ